MLYVSQGRKDALCIPFVGGKNLAVSIRLKRRGRKRKPFYRVIVADSRTPRQGVTIDDLGYYNPMTDPPQVQLNEEKALSWLKEGAIPTDTVRSLLSKAGLIQKFRGHEQPIEEPEEQPVAKEEVAKPAVEEEKEEESEAAEESDSEPSSESDDEPADE